MIFDRNRVQAIAREVSGVLSANDTATADEALIALCGVVACVIGTRVDPLMREETIRRCMQGINTALSPEYIPRVSALQ